MRPCLGCGAHCAPHLALCHVGSLAEIPHETPRLRRDQVHAIGGHCEHGACELAAHVLSRADPQLDVSVRCPDGGPVTELWQRISSPMTVRLLTVTDGGMQHGRERTRKDAGSAVPRALMSLCPAGGAPARHRSQSVALRLGAAVYHRYAMQFLFSMKQTKLVKPKPVSKREVYVDTRTPSGRRTLLY